LVLFLRNVGSLLMAERSFHNKKHATIAKRRISITIVITLLFICLHWKSQGFYEL
jgi:hypothetical protein